jgi:acetoin utilization protein AcuC
MGTSLTLPWDDALLGYDLGPAHPLAPVRVELTISLARSFGLLDRPNVNLATVTQASDELLKLVHSSDYIEAVRNADHTSHSQHVRHGFGTPDTPAFPQMHAASALVVGATMAATQAVWSGTSQHGVNVAGGLHHAMRSNASGFCVYNDPAIAIAWLLDQGAERVAYVDVDVHHGDGVEAAFWDDPRVLTISLHEHPATLFPGTGLPDDIGGPHAKGYAVNVALPAGTGDDQWLRAFDAVVPPLLHAFSPEFLVTQHGCDAHRLDPLAHLELSIDCQRLAIERLHALAHETSSGRWIALGGGGYELVQVVPRVWTHLIAEAAGAAISPLAETPAAWRTHVKARTGSVAPQSMTDGFSPTPRPWDQEPHSSDLADRAIRATRRSVFPFYGLTP